MTRTPLASLMTLSVIAIALALPGAMVVALDNFAKLGGQFDGAKRLSVFFIGDIDQLRVRKVGAELQTRTEVATLREVSPNAAIEEFAAMGGSRTALDNLAGQNPFPWMLELELKREYADPEQIQSLVAELKQYPAISEVIYDRVWLERLFALMSLGGYVAIIVASMLGFGVVLVVGNTIRLEIGARRDELEILALFGGTNAFIRRPFLWTGAWYGAAGGMMATVILLVSCATECAGSRSFGGLCKHLPAAGRPLGTHGQSDGRRYVSGVVGCLGLRKPIPECLQIRAFVTYLRRGNCQEYA